MKHLRNTTTLLILLAFLQNLDVSGQGLSPAGRLAADSELKGASVGLVAYDMLTGEVLDQHDSERRLCPASIWKVATTAAAVDILGADFRFKTILAWDGQIEGRSLYGNIYIIGGGDPSLGSSHLGGGLENLVETWSVAVAALGVDSIHGHIIGNSAHFRGDGLPRTRVWEDMGNYYGAAVSGLNIHDNTFYIKFRVPDEPGLPCSLSEIRPEVPGLSIHSEVLSSPRQSDLAYIFGAPGSAQRVVRGTLPAGKRSYEIKGSLPDPALFAAFQLYAGLKTRGVYIQGEYRPEHAEVKEPATMKVLHRHESPSLSVLVRHTNHRSDNLFAEALTCQIGVHSGNPTLEGGLDALRNYYKPVCASQVPFFIYDGSGLSRFTSISPSQMMQIWMHLRSKPELNKHILMQLPKAGSEGTLTYFCRGTVLEGNLKGKSGSMDGVRCYAGSFAALTGREIGFVCMVNSFDTSKVDVKRIIEKWLVEAYNRY